MLNYIKIKCKNILNDNIKLFFRNFFNVLIFILLAVYIYVFFEWLFFVTKPSSVNTMTTYEALKTLFVTPFPIFLYSLLIAIPFVMFGTFMGMLVPSFIISCTIFLLVENFTRTLFSFNISNFQSNARYFYTIVFLCLILFIAHSMNRLLSNKYIIRNLKVVSGCCLVFSCLFLMLNFFNHDTQYNFEIKTTKQINTTNLPNILILSADGLDANHLSAYGYYRDTTPYLKSMMNECLVADNHFANGQSTIVSIASFLSGKPATQTRVLRVPDHFKGKHAYEHFPGILRKLGYRSMDLGTSGEADPLIWGMKNGFDVCLNQAHLLANIQIEAWLEKDKIYSLLDPEEKFFTIELLQRIVPRFLHLFNISSFKDHHEMLTSLCGVSTDDATKVGRVINFIDESQKPFFIHTHFMITHGPVYPAAKEVWGKSQPLSENPPEQQWNNSDFYDNAILTFDDYVRTICEHLKKIGRYDNTIVVITSDHPQMRYHPQLKNVEYLENPNPKQGVTFNKVPLLIKFPQNKHAQKILYNTQRLDIPPTVLDYLGVVPPEWMHGTSILSGKIDASRPIIITHSTVDCALEESHKLLYYAKKYNSPPFYTLNAIMVVQGDKASLLNLYDLIFHPKADIQGHTYPLDTKDLMTDAETLTFLINHLKEMNYDVSSILPGVYKNGFDINKNTHD